MVCKCLYCKCLDAVRQLHTDDVVDGTHLLGAVCRASRTGAGILPSSIFQWTDTRGVTLRFFDWPSDQASQTDYGENLSPFPDVGRSA